MELNQNRQEKPIVGLYRLTMSATPQTLREFQPGFHLVRHEDYEDQGHPQRWSIIPRLK